MNKNIKALLLTVGIMILIGGGLIGYWWIAENYSIALVWVWGIVAFSMIFGGIFLNVKDHVK